MRELKITPAINHELATSLVRCFRERRIEIPDDELLRDELLRLRLKETAMAKIRMDHVAGHHDDQAFVLAVLSRSLLDGPRLASLLSPTRIGQLPLR